MHSMILSDMVSFSSATAGSDNKISYLIGGIIALLILGYLIYTLMHPEKF